MWVHQECWREVVPAPVTVLLNPNDPTSFYVWRPSPTAFLTHDTLGWNLSIVKEIEEKEEKKKWKTCLSSLGQVVDFRKKKKEHEKEKTLSEL